MKCDVCNGTGAIINRSLVNEACKKCMGTGKIAEPPKPAVPAVTPVPAAPAPEKPKIA